MRATLPLLATNARPLLVARSGAIAATDTTAILDAGTAALTGAAFLAVAASTVPLVSWLLYELYVADLRKQRSQGRRTKSRSIDASSSAYVRPRELWRLSELAEYDGTQSTDGPILLAAGEDGLVYNVARARHLYGPGAEYSVMAGTDASRLLAKNTVKPETEAEAATPLNMAELAALSAKPGARRQVSEVVHAPMVGKEAADSSNIRRVDVRVHREGADVASPCAHHGVAHRRQPGGATQPFDSGLYSTTGGRIARPPLGGEDVVDRLKGALGDRPVQPHKQVV